MSTIKQLIREFWVPFLLAVGWTFYSLWESAQDRNVAGAVKTFSAAFFLLSWASGNFVRVRRQSRTDNSLKTVENKLVGLTDDLGAATDKLINTVTGGNSYAYVSLSEMGGAVFTPFLVHQGDYPLSNLSARIVDLEKFQAAVSAGGDLLKHDVLVRADELAPHTAIQTNAQIPIGSSPRDWNIFLSARNGHWVQQLRGRVVNGKWVFAHIVTKDDETLGHRMPADFPLIGDALFDELERDPPTVSTEPNEDAD